MPTSDSAPRGGWLNMATVQSRWGWTLALGIVLLACGAAAITLPVLAGTTLSLVLAAVLGVSGVAKIVQGLKVREWIGANMHILLGAAEIVGGALIYLYPVKGALAVALLLAVMFLIEAVMQISLAIRSRPEPGWIWLLVAGLIALVASFGLATTVRYTDYLTPGTLAGAAIIAAGWACIMMALAKQQAKP